MAARLIGLFSLLLMLPFVALLAWTCLLLLPTIFATYQCVPPVYPSLAASPMAGGTPVKTFTADPIEKVRDAYAGGLNAEYREELHSDSLWMIEAVQEDYLLQCYNTPTSLDIECGGILLKPADNRTSIERVWHVSEGLGCDQFLQLPKEYYSDAP